MPIKNIELQSTMEWLNAAYVDDSGQEYFAVITRNFDTTSGFGEKEVVNVEKDGMTVPHEAPVWREISEALEKEETKSRCRNVSFTIEIDRNWLETLEELIDQILVCSPCSPAEALEATIFSQIKQQFEG